MYILQFLGALVSLLTLEPNQYGPSGQINMKIVETLVPAEPDSEQDEKPGKILMY